VAPTVVVTAAHCVDNHGPSDLRVVYGHAIPEQAPTSERRLVSQAVAHPGYQPNAPLDAYGLGPVNDIGVLVLEEPIEGAIVTPILPNDQVDPVLYPNRVMHIVGFGIHDTNTQASGVLYKGLTPHVRHVPSELLGGRTGEPDACFGDSGGPAYVVDNNTLWLVGATSRAWEHAVQPCGHATVYTLVPHFTKWIESVGGVLDGGVVDGGFHGGGWDASDEPDGALLDGNPTCVPLNSACHPLTNEGCDAAAGEACRFDAKAGTVACFAGANVVEPGKTCDQTSRFCMPGFFCGASIRCEKVCCSDADCPDGVPCTPLISLLGDIGTCGPVSMVVDAGVPDALPDALADVPVDSGASDAPISHDAGDAAPDSLDDGGGDAAKDAEQDADFGPPDAIEPGCACAQGPSPASGVPWLLLASTVGIGWARRRRASLMSP
jgi:MYXO-CTERM domain-containing protein